MSVDGLGRHVLGVMDEDDVREAKRWRLLLPKKAKLAKRRMKSLSPFMKEFVQIQVGADLFVQASGFMFCTHEGEAIPLTVKEWLGPYYSSEGDDTAPYDGFGWDHFECRLVERGESVDFYGWCYNSHGSQQVYSCSKTQFLGMFRQIATTINGKNKQESYDLHNKLFRTTIESFAKGEFASW